MVHKRIYLAFVPILLSLFGCATFQDSTTGDAESAGPVIVHLRTRHQLITIYSTSAGPRFTVHTANGQLLDRDLNIRELEERHSSIHKLYRSAIASDGVLLDASLSTQVLQRSTSR